MKKYNQQFALELYNIPNVYDYLQTSSMETVKKKKLQIHQTKYKIGLQVVPREESSWALDEPSKSYSNPLFGCPG